MRPGLVGYIRVNPTDCQSVLDLAEAIGLDTRKESFTRLASIALSSLLAAARDSGRLPPVDPFQFDRRLGHFRGTHKTQYHHKVSEMINASGGNRVHPVLPSASIDPTEAKAAMDGLAKKGRAQWDEFDEILWINSYSIVYPDKRMEYPE